MTASALCMVHCLVVPLFIVFMPFLSWMETGEDAHRYLAAFAVLPALAGLMPGYFVHRRGAVLLCGFAGLIFIIGGAWVIGPHFGEIAEAIVTVAGTVTLFMTHLINHRQCLLCSNEKALFYNRMQLSCKIAPE